MGATAASVFLAALLLPCLYAAWTDLSALRIPNAVVLVCVAIYVLLGPIVLPLDAYLGRFVPAAVMLVIGFLLSLTGQFGAGDAKYGAALTLFIAREDLATAMQIYAFMALAGVVVVRGLPRLAPPLATALGWRSFRVTRAFPLGLALSGTVLFYLALVIAVQRAGT